MSQPEKKPSFISSFIAAIKKVFSPTAPQQPTPDNGTLPDLAPKTEPVKRPTEYHEWQHQAASSTEAKPEATTPAPRKGSNPA